MSQTHELKTLPVYFDAVRRGEKTFEIRKDDRGFQKGDIVRLRRFDPSSDDRWHWGAFPASYPTVERRVSWILTGGQFGLEPGYVILALADPPPPSPLPAPASCPGGEG